MSKRILSFLILFSFASIFLSAAQVTGIVKDDRSKVVSGVTVYVKNTDNVTVTDLEGKFTLQIPGHPESVVLVFERDGFHPREKRVAVDGGVKTFKFFFISQEQDLHKITVTAMNREKKTVHVPMAEHAVTELEIREKLPENIMESLVDTPGVHFIGSGGFSITPTIRGLARRRVLVMVDGHRITSDRRAGTSPSFVPPELAQRVEVVRSSSSVLYGSDAIGGVINILTRTSSADKPAWENNGFNLNYNSSSDRFNTGFTYGINPGKWQVFTGFQYITAGNYSDPDDEIYHSGYTLYSGIFDVAYKSKERDFYIGYIGGFGEDIGKPDRANDPNEYTNVPKQSDQIIRLGYSEKSWVNNGSLEVSMFFNPTTYVLDKFRTSKNRIEKSDTRATNLGLKAYLKKNLPKNFTYQIGIDWFSRQNLKAKNDVVSMDTGLGDPSYPLREGTRNDYSAFMTLDYEGFKNWEIDGGFRYTYFSIDAISDEVYKEKNTGSYSFFFGVTRKLSESVSIFCNISRAFRFPSLGETYYTGLTGRKYVIGNENLEPEKSLNFDTGLKIATGKFSMGLYFFTYRIDNMIERYKDDDGIYHYDNVMRGDIYGTEVEARYRPISSLDFFGHFFYYHGRTGGSEPEDNLNDLPSPRFLIGGKTMLGQLWFEVDLLHSFEKTDPGPAEVGNDAYTLLDIKSGYYFSSKFYFYVKLANLLNQRYYANPDPDIPYAKGFNLAAGIHYYF